MIDTGGETDYAARHAADDSDPGSIVPRFTPKKPVSTSLVWMILFPLAMVAIGIAGFLLFESGTRDVLDDTGGAKVVEAIEDPAAPGYVAVAVPTPTALVAHTDDDETLVGVTVLIGDADENGGGSFVVLPSNTALVPPDGEQALTLDTIFAEQGVDALATTVGAAFGFGFTESPTVLDSEAFASLIDEVAPLELVVLDPLADDDGEPSLAPGAQELDAEALAFYFEALDGDEAVINRTERQRRVWDAWFESLGASVDGEVPLPDFDEGITAMIADMAVAPVGDVTFPVRAYAPGGGPGVYVVVEDEADELAALAASLVPLPTSPYPGGRAKVELRDGAGNVVNRDGAVAPLVAAGAEIVLIRNNETFDTESTEVVYYDEAFAELADSMADVLGAGGATLLETAAGGAVDVVVTLGPDWDISG